MIDRIRKAAPVIHCITNYVTANDVANIILAAGGKPVMADFPGEVEEITGQCDGLVMNLGTLNEERTKALLLAGRRAATQEKPVILDPVGIGASRFRMEKMQQILRQISVSIIRGNSSEIAALVKTDSPEETVAGMRLLSKRSGAVIVLTGESDIITDGEQIAYIRNGHPLMTRITGTGCMLDGILAVFAAGGGTNYFQTAVNACAAFGLCGQIAGQRMQDTGGGTGSFRSSFLDAMSNLDDSVLTEGMKVEYR